jgi:hypothetical protein
MHPLPALCSDRQRKHSDRSAFASAAFAGGPLLSCSVTRVSKLPALRCSGMQHHLGSTTQSPRPSSSASRTSTLANHLHSTTLASLPKILSPDPRLSYSAYADRTLLFALLPCWAGAKHAPSRVAGLGALTLPTLPSAFPERDGLAHPCHPCCCCCRHRGTADFCACATQSRRFKSIIRSDTRFAQIAQSPLPKNSAWATRLLQFDLHCRRLHVHEDGHGLATF